MNEPFDCYLVEVDYNGYDKSIITITRTLAGAQQAALAWVKQRPSFTDRLFGIETVQELDWWQPGEGEWQTNTPLDVDHISIQGWTFADAGALDETPLTADKQWMVFARYTTSKRREALRDEPFCSSEEAHALLTEIIQEFQGRERVRVEEAESGIFTVHWSTRSRLYWVDTLD